jgi:hypothetical protein
MSIWGSIREFAMRDVEVLEPGRQLTVQAVVESVLGLVIVTGALVFLDYRSPDPLGILYCLAGLAALIKGIYDFAR